MNSDDCIRLLQRQTTTSIEVEDKEPCGPEWRTWKRNTEVVIQKIFGQGGSHLADFQSISYSLRFITNTTPDSAFREAYLEGLATAKGILKSMIDEITDFGVPSQITQRDGTIEITTVLERFHSVARRLLVRHDNRSTLRVEDEYDVQDLLHSLLNLVSDDIREEEWTPSYAGKSLRVDFLLKKERIVVEAKKTSKIHGPKGDR